LKRQRIEIVAISHANNGYKQENRPEYGKKVAPKGQLFAKEGQSNQRGTKKRFSVRVNAPSKKVSD